MGDRTTDINVGLYRLHANCRMKFLESRLVAATDRFLENGRSLIATVSPTACGLIAAVKERPDIELVQVIRKNRGILPDYIYRCLDAVLASP